MPGFFTRIGSKWRALLFLVLAGVLFWVGQHRLHIDSDITSALPQNDPVVSSAREILNRHPALDHIYIELHLADSQPGGTRENISVRDDLAQAADMVEQALTRSDLVEVIGSDKMASFIPILNHTVIGNLPLFFSKEDLESIIAPLLKPEKIESELTEALKQLSDLDGIGQGRYLDRDPLGLRNKVLSRLAGASPFGESVIYKGHIYNKAHTRVLIIAEPKSSGGDTAFGRRLRDMLGDVDHRLDQIKLKGGKAVKMVYAGSFLAALDNEEIIRRDTQRAVILVSIGVVLLVLVSFRRPGIGLLAIVPAVCGVMLATFAYSLFRNSIFAVSLGFGGALISITVDHALAWLLLYDVPGNGRGKNVSREVWSVSSFTVYTTVAALLTLTLSGIPLFEEVGLFAALGVGLAAFSVHIFFPLLFTGNRGSDRSAILPPDRILKKLAAWSGRKVLIGAVLVTMVLAFWARPEFNTDIGSMNTMRPETLVAEETIRRHWGALSSRPYIMAVGRDREDLWRASDRLSDLIRTEAAQGVFRDTPLRSSLFPGPLVQKENLEAWQTFWTPDRRASLRLSLNKAGAKLGFSTDAFDPFLSLLDAKPDLPVIWPESLYPPLGIFPDKQGGWLLLEGLTPGPNYDPGKFFNRAAAEDMMVFDPDYFSVHLAGTLNRSFVKMLAIIGLAALVLMFFLFVDWALVLLSITPLVFSLIATLGTLGLLGLPLSLPSLMLGPVILGLGMDYGLYLVRSRQRFGSIEHPFIKENQAIRSFQAAVLLGGISTLVGMGSLALSRHQVLQSAGITTFLGISYALIGALVLVPPILDRLFPPASEPDTEGPIVPGSREHQARVLRRFRRLEPHPRLFARFKMKLDPMFPRLADFVPPSGTIVDLGCGYGVPSAWLLALHGDPRIFCLEPDAERARVARKVLGARARVFTAKAEELADIDVPRADAALMLDMAHYLSDEDFKMVLNRLRIVIGDGPLIMRITIPGGRRSRWQRGLETVKMKWAGLTPNYRTREAVVAILEKAGFDIEIIEPTAPGREETWFVARA